MPVPDSVWEDIYNNLTEEQINDNAMMKEYLASKGVSLSDIIDDFPSSMITEMYTPDELVQGGIPEQVVSTMYPAEVLAQSNAFRTGALPSANQGPPVTGNLNGEPITLEDAIAEGATQQDLRDMGFPEEVVAAQEATVPSPMGNLGGSPISLSDALSAGASKQDLLDMGFPPETANGIETPGPGLWDSVTGGLTNAAKTVGSALGINTLADLKKIVSPVVQGAGTVLQRGELLNGINNAKGIVNNAYTQNMDTLKPWAASQTADLNAARGTIANIPKLAQADMPSLNANLGQKAVTADDWKQANITQG